MANEKKVVEKKPVEARKTVELSDIYASEAKRLKAKNPADPRVDDPPPPPTAPKK